LNHKISRKKWAKRLFKQREDKLAKKLIKKAGMYKLNSTFTIANLGQIEIVDNLKKLKIKTLFGPMYHSNAMEKYIGSYYRQ
jgi:ABC-type metal ion transport system substrate-binding protein